MRTVFFLTLLLISGQAAAQAVKDADKRGFIDLTPVRLDIDGDGRLDEIQPRTYTRRQSTVKSPQDHGVRRTHWITFDLYLASGAKEVSFFSYRYGDNRADYWVWALNAAGDLDRDGRTDLVFYSGDDTTDETVALLQRSTGFKASSIGHLRCDLCMIDDDFNTVALGKYDVGAGRQIPDRIVAKWNPRHGYFEGDGMLWIRDGRVPLREAATDSGRVLEWFDKDDAVIAKLENGVAVIRGKWVMVETGWGTGWMERASLVSTSQMGTALGPA